MNTLRKPLHYLLLGILVASYALFLLLGSQTRHIQDDYCYGEKPRNEGFWQAQIDSYFGSVPYPGNRYALTFFSGLFEMLFSQHYPAFNYFSILAFMAGLILLAKHLFRALGIEVSTLLVSLLALALGFIMFYIAPNRFQTLYFRAASISYFYGVVFQVWVGVFFLLYIEKKKGLLLIPLGLLALIASGFGEVGAVIQFSLWIFFLIVFWFKDKKKENLLAGGVIIAATVVGLLLLILCPNNLERQVNFGEPNSIANVVRDGPLFALDFVSYTTRGYSLPILVLFLVGFVLAHEIDSPFTTNKQALLFLLTAVLLGYALIVANILPSLYAYSAIPDNRGLSQALFNLLAVVLMAGLVLGWLFKENIKLSSQLTAILKVGLLVVISLYLARAGWQVWQEFPKYQQRAQQWDARNTKMLSAVEAGEQELIVPALDSFYRTAELQADPGHWVNTCAARYYGVDSITALE